MYGNNRLSNYVPFPTRSRKNEDVLEIVPGHETVTVRGRGTEKGNGREKEVIVTETALRESGKENVERRRERGEAESHEIAARKGRGLTAKKRRRKRKTRKERRKRKGKETEKRRKKKKRIKKKNEKSLKLFQKKGKM